MFRFFYCFNWRSPGPPWLARIALGSLGVSSLRLTPGSFEDILAMSILFTLALALSEPGLLLVFLSTPWPQFR